MMHFNYKGRNANGDLVEGIVNSLNKEFAAEVLKRDGITPISVTIIEKPQEPLQKFMAYFHRVIHRPSLTDLIIFSRQMYSLTKAGVPIIRAIHVVADSVKNECLVTSLEDILLKLEGGQNLSSCMAQYPEVFPPLMQSLVNVGENTGNLDKVFYQIAIHLERESMTKKRLKSAMRYPLMVIITIMIAIGIINVLVVPAFASFFQSFGANLPLPTRILIASSNLTINYWYFIVIGILISTSSWIAYLKTDNGRMFWDFVKLKIPLVGSIIERSLLARFSRSFALTSKAGVPLLESIGIIAKTTDNVFVAERIMSMRKNIEHGESLTNAARYCGMFSPLVLQMMSIGEETGEVDRLLDEVSDFYEQELDYDLKKLSEAIEPIMIAIVAVMVLILALGVFLPMWDISRVALGK